MSSDSTYGSPSGRHNSTIEYAENAVISSVAGKKVFIVGSDGNQVSSATSTIQTDGSQKTQIVPLPAVFNGTKTVPTGTSEAVASTQAISSVTIKSLSTNTVAVYVGNSACTVANGFELLAGESVSLDVDNLTDCYVISGSASQVVRYIAA